MYAWGCALSQPTGITTHTSHNHALLSTQFVDASCEWKSDLEYKSTRMVSWQWPWSKKGLVQGPKSVNIFLGFFFLVNFCVGTGFLGIPYSFFYAGYLAAIPTFLLIAFASWNAGRWEIEIMARAQVCTVRKSQLCCDESEPERCHHHMTSQATAM